jgi:hypothetical protein
MEGNLNFIEQLGMDEPSADVTEASTESESTTEETQDLSLESDNTEVSEKTQEATEPNEMEELKKQMEVMQKRIDDKDAYIQELREQSKQQEAESSTEEVDEANDDFWEDPEGKYKQLQQQVLQQQMYMQEIKYANSQSDYWKTVDPDGDGTYKAVRDAVAADPEFGKQMQNHGGKGYEIAYNYLKTKSETKAKSEQTLREQIRQEEIAKLQKEGIVKSKKETVPSTTGLSSSNGSSAKSSSDGFMEVFGAM